MESILATFFISFGALFPLSVLSYIIYNCLMAYREIAEKNLREAMVVRDGRDLAMDVSGAGIKRLHVADLGKYEAREVVKEGEMWTVYWSERMDTHYSALWYKGAVLEKDAGSVKAKILFLSIACVAASVGIIWGAISVIIMFWQ